MANFKGTTRNRADAKSPTGNLNTCAAPTRKRYGCRTSEAAREQTDRSEIDPCLAAAHCGLEILARRRRRRGPMGIPPSLMGPATTIMPARRRYSPAPTGSGPDKYFSAQAPSELRNRTILSHCPATPVPPSSVDPVTTPGAGATRVYSESVFHGKLGRSACVGQRTSAAWRPRWRGRRAGFLQR
jgi:hypothetical protein